jgi:translocation and assembly module TamB
VFSLEADLGKFPGAHSQGQIAGEIVFEPDRNFSPKLTARLTANGVFAFGLLVKNLELEATQSGAELAVGRARLALAGDAKAEISGRYTWRTRTLTEVAVRAQLNSTALAPWLPPAIAFSALALEARVHGSLDAPVHEGKFSVDALEIGTPRPILSSGEWSGVGAQAERVELSVQTGDTRASAFGQITRDAATIRSLELLLGGVEKLQLARPTLVRWQPSLDLGPVELLGETTSLFAAWQGGAVKRAKFTATRFDFRWLRDLTSLSPRAWQIESLDFSGAWPDGRLLGVLKLDGVWSPVGGKSARFSVAARSDDNGIEVERFLVSDDGGTVAQAGGRAPLAIRPETEIKLAMLTDARWSLELKTTPDSPFWAAQAAASGVIVRAPKLTARIEGAAQNPEARLQLQAAEVSLPRRPLPPLTEVAAELALGDRRLVLEKFSVLVAGQPLSATGRATLPAAEWSELLKNPRALWTGDAEARVRLPLLQIASLREFLPDIVIPSGTLAGDFAVNARGEIEGALTVCGASTHPVSPFGSFREIGGEMVFDGRRAELKTLHAQAGGQPVELRGAIAFPKNAPLALDVSLVGKNLSLARETGLLVRGDLDLTLKTAEDGTTTIGGAVNVHDSLFLRDVRSLIPARGGGAANRPPYFSVIRAPFRDWRLAVKVSGERFMKVRTPLFDGAISGDIQLGGTLREPLAIGAITVAGGAVRLPFAALEMRGGAVRLMQADPFSPQLDLEAEGRAFGYDLRMAINGPASEPALTFSSSPALSSEQVLLMVMAGETPRNEIVFSGTQRARRFGTYLGRGLISDLFGGGSAADRLSISSGENVTESGRETYTIEYELGRHWTAVGEYDKFDDYNLGLKWRIFSPKRKDLDVR